MKAPDLALLLSPPPSLNRSLRMHWTKRRKIGQGYDLEVLAKASAGDGRRPWLAWPKASSLDLPLRRTVQFTHIGRRLDPDSEVGSLKPVIDAMVHVGLLVDDSARYLYLLVRSEPGRPQALRVEIWKGAR